MQIRKTEVLRGPFPGRQLALWKMHNLHESHKKQLQMLIGITELMRIRPEIDKMLVSFFNAEDLMTKKHRASMRAIKEESDDLKSFEMFKKELSDYHLALKQLQMLRNDFGPDEVNEVRIMFESLVGY